MTSRGVAQKWTRNNHTILTDAGYAAIIVDVDAMSDRALVDLDANLNLIAAAPELVEALEEVLRVFESPASTISAPHTVRKVKAALAAARGGK